jgi:hypothetical protein
MVTQAPNLFHSLAAEPANPAPQYAPPIPPTNYLEGFRQVSELAGFELMPWQERLAATITGYDQDTGLWTYPEVCAVVSRQNGKTKPLTARVLLGMLRGERIGHAAQHRELPRRTFLEVAHIVETVPQFARLLKGMPRLSNGQEEIRFKNGARYRIAADTPGGMRGWDNDLLIIDEVREQANTDFLAASLGTLTASANPQTIYLSNAGDEESVVLNELRRRGLEGDELLAYLEWSAPAHLAAEDRTGWVAANPGLGFTITMRNLEALHRALPPERFEVEHLCRWVASMAPRLVSSGAITRAVQAGAGGLEPYVRPAVGVAVDPGGRRASAVAAWVQSDGSVAVAELGDWRGEPVELEAVASALNEFAVAGRPTAWVFDPWSDSELSRQLSSRAKLEPLTGRAWASASAAWVHLAESGRLRLAPGGFVEDMPYLERRTRGDGTYVAQRPDSGRPVTAGLAAVRAAWIASAPRAPTPAIR